LVIVDSRPVGLRPVLEVVEPRSAESDASVVSFPASPATISLIIPTLNEERNIAWVLERVPSFVDEILLIDGRSTDRTVEVALTLRPDIVVIREPQPGKGVALRTGFAQASGDIVIMLDADGSMDPGEIEQFVAAIENGADVVKGSRYLPGGGSVDISRLRWLGNAGLLRTANLLYRTSYSELCYGYMAFRRSAIAELDLRATGFEIETEIVVRATRAGFRIDEVASFESHRRFGTSHLHTFRDGWRVLKTLIRERLRPASGGLAAKGVVVAVSIQEPQRPEQS
jgi:glycosyltransferase involved in cell wall biosynthesis